MFGRTLLMTSIFLLSAGLTAFAGQHESAPHPAVKLRLSGDLLAIADGKTVATPVEKAVLKKGDLVRYTIVASNAGGKPAVALSTIGPVPQRTQYVDGSASQGAGALVEYSLDGKTFSARPTITVNTSRGPVSKPAPPDEYVAIRWTSQRPLSPKHVERFSYEVRVK